MVLDAQQMETSLKILILSDKRAGHENQSIAFAKHLNASYDIFHVEFKTKALKLLSYLLDFMSIYTKRLFICKEISSSYDFIISAGSSTYYANKTLSKKHKIKSIALMLPKNYRFDFDYIFAQSHDNPPKKNNIIEIPANFSFIEPKQIYKPQKKSIGIIIGGDNSIFKMSIEKLKKQLDEIKKYFLDYEIAITTSPRTSKKIEELIESYEFEFSVIFSKNQINPIPDFLQNCEYVFITIDSTSMISEAISYGNSCVEVLPIDDKKDNKFYKMTKALETDGFLHIFDGKIADANKKIDFKSYAKKAIL